MRLLSYYEKNLLTAQITNITLRKWYLLHLWSHYSRHN